MRSEINLSNSLSPDVALAQAEHWLPAHLELLADLVTNNSHADNLEGLVSCLALLGRALTELGFAVTRKEATVVDSHEPAQLVTRPHLFAHRDAETGRLPTILLLGHVDTVFAKTHSFQTLQRDGAVWRGPGVTDMKGGLVTALLALRILREAGLIERANWRVLFVTDEEQGSPTGQKLIPELARGIDLALCFEAARDCGSLVKARKGYARAYITVRGKTGHAGIAHDTTVNAFTALCRFVAGAEALEAMHPGVTVSPGGRVEVRPASVNMVPDHAACELEWRFFELAAGESVLRELGALATRLGAEMGAEINVRGGIENVPMEATDKSEAVLGHYIAAARELGMNIGGVATAGVGDINDVARYGAVCLDGVGPEGGGMHTDGEFLHVSSVARRAAMNALALSRWLGQNATATMP